MFLRHHDTSRTSGTTYPMTQQNIPEGLHLYNTLIPYGSLQRLYLFSHTICWLAEPDIVLLQYTQTHLPPKETSCRKTEKIKNILSHNNPMWYNLQCIVVVVVIVVISVVVIVIIIVVMCRRHGCCCCCCCCSSNSMQEVCTLFIT
jgi:hypothetical protein